MSNINNSLKINDNLIMGESTHTHDDLMKIKGDTRTSINYYTNWNFYSKIFEVEKFTKNGEYITLKLNLSITEKSQTIKQYASLFIHIINDNKNLKITYKSLDLQIQKNLLPLIVEDDKICLYYYSKNYEGYVNAQIQYVDCPLRNVIDNLFKDNSGYLFESLTEKEVYYPEPSTSYVESTDDINDLGNYQWDNSIVGRLAIQNSKSLNAQALKIAIKNSENATKYENIQLARSCTTFYRPKDNLTVGTSVFDTTLGKPIWCKSVTEYEDDGVTVKTQAVWVDATGTEV